MNLHDQVMIESQEKRKISHTYLYVQHDCFKLKLFSDGNKSDESLPTI